MGLNSTSDIGLKVKNKEVVRERKTGWQRATGTKSRQAFVTSTVTTAELAQRVAALIDDLHDDTGHGLIGDA